MEDLNQQFRNTYIAECYELLQEMEEKLLSVDNSNLEEINAIFRCAHSIKGGAGAFGFTEITKFTHALEALLDSMREGIISITSEAVDVLLKSVDIVTQMVELVSHEQLIPDDLGKEVLEELDKMNQPATVGQQSSTPETTTEIESDITPETNYLIKFIPEKILFQYGNEPLLLLKELSELGETTTQPDISSIPSLHEIHHEDCYIKWNILLKAEKSINDIKEVFEFVEDDCKLEIEVVDANANLDDVLETDPTTNDDQPEAITTDDTTKNIKTTEPTNTKTPPTQTTTTSIRVDVNKVDRLVNMVGELVITQSVLVAQTKNLSADTFAELLRAVEELNVHTRELQESVMSVRMQPVKTIFSRMPRIVRDLSQKLNKNIVLEMQGENTEIDKTVIEQLSDPLTHMIRNSIDHGIELPEDRVKAGKPEQGTIILSADHQGGRIVIDISDNGNGINRDVVLNKAIEKGLVSADANLSPEEIDHLIFLPGFSTAATVSDISGRGVGMDVVRRNIEVLGGSVSIHNRPGKGSSMSVSLPLTLAILDGMIVASGDEKYVIPINNIIETIRPAKGEINHIADGSDIINVRGDFIKIVRLDRMFNIKGNKDDLEDLLIILVENGQNKFGIAVEELIGQQQVVIKTLNEYSDIIKGISGATILGDGNVSLIIDINDIYSMSTLSQQQDYCNGTQSESSSNTTEILAE
jgi:two-component system chemotaxis sensor kinase CheA